jgi:hypothetical protein
MQNAVARKVVQEGRSTLARIMGMVNKNVLRPATNCCGVSANATPTVIKTRNSALASQPLMYLLRTNNSTLPIRRPVVSQKISLTSRIQSSRGVVNQSQIVKVINRTPSRTKPAKIIFNSFPRRASSGSPDGTSSHLFNLREMFTTCLLTLPVPFPWHLKSPP